MARCVNARVKELLIQEFEKRFRFCGGEVSPVPFGKLQIRDGNVIVVVVVPTSQDRLAAWEGRGPRGDQGHRGRHADRGGGARRGAGPAHQEEGAAHAPRLSTLLHHRHEDYARQHQVGETL